SPGPDAAIRQRSGSKPWFPSDRSRCRHVQPRAARVIPDEGEARARPSSPACRGRWREAPEEPEDATFLPPPLAGGGGAKRRWREAPEEPEDATFLPPPLAGGGGAQRRRARPCRAAQ